MTFGLWTSQLRLINDTIRLMSACNTHQELQQSVRSIDIVDNFIHVLHWSLAELLHHKENIDQQSTKDLQKREEVTFMYITSIIWKSEMSFCQLVHVTCSEVRIEEEMMMRSQKSMWKN